MNQQKVGVQDFQLTLFNKRRKEMTDAERVSMLHAKLYQKAKQEREYKFYVLYDKMFIAYMLRDFLQILRFHKM